jgi:DDE superfamily endonuclease
MGPGQLFSIQSTKTVAKWCKVYIRKIAGLLTRKTGTLEENSHGLIFFMSIDGVHCQIEEPKPFNKRWASHKFGMKAAVNYEVGVSLHEPKLLWVYSPTAPGELTDLTVFQKCLKHHLPIGARLIADGIYASEPEYISTKNDLDSEEIRQFKNRAMARQENFNQLLKVFEVLNKVYRHGVKESANIEESDNIPHGESFRACCVLTMFQLENKSTHLLDPYP